MSRTPRKLRRDAGATETCFPNIRRLDTAPTLTALGGERLRRFLVEPVRQLGRRARLAADALDGPDPEVAAFYLERLHAELDAAMRDLDAAVGRELEAP